jgi:hypothetical protein
VRIEENWAFRWDETAGLAEELSFPERTRGAKGDQPSKRLANTASK